MIKALQSSGRAMSVQLQRHELIANNLANANTPGFQRLIGRVRELQASATTPGAAAAQGPGRLIVESIPSRENGPLQATGNPLDVALMGDGYFLVETAQGERLTRDGAFSLSSEGELLHSSGSPVLADGSSVSIRGQASILPDGTILDGEQIVGRLSVVRPEEGAGVIREGENLLRIEGEYEEAPAGEVRVVSGHIEGANVHAVEEMVDMIRAFRAYEIAQRAAQAADDTLRIAVERVGVLRA